MKYYEDKDITLYHGKMQDELNNLADNSIDSIICDPPYELNFLGKSWDNSGVAFQKETWEKCFRVLKTGGYLLAFGGTRTYHRIACAIEDAGFEIRDCIMWLYGSGFPKSMNIGLAIDKKDGVESEVVGIGNSGSANTHTRCMNSTTQSGKDVFGGQCEIKKASNKWNGWGTCLKPAFEPIIIARKPFDGSLIDNVLEYGVGGLNIDECRVEFGNETDSRVGTDAVNNTKCGFWQKDGNNGTTQMYKDKGRFPANVITDGSDEVASGMPYTKSEGDTGETSTTKCFSNVKCGSMKNTGDNLGGSHDKNSAMRYFYQAKASKKDRDDGLEGFDSIVSCDRNPESYSANTALNRSANARKNTHPTVKPVELMQYLVRLVSPKGSTVLDCFMGSGSTGKAVMFENREREANYHFIGIEMTDEYLPIAKARILYGRDKYQYEIKKIEKETGQISFDLE